MGSTLCARHDAVARRDPRPHDALLKGRSRTSLPCMDAGRSARLRVSRGFGVCSPTRRGKSVSCPAFSYGRVQELVVTLEDEMSRTELIRIAGALDEENVASVGRE